MIKIALIGATGRMGNELLRAIDERSSDYQLAAPISKNNSDAIYGLDYDVAIDFTNKEATIANLNTYIKNKKPVVIGTTGFNQDELLAIQNAARVIPILLSYNMSSGANATAMAAGIVARALDTQEIDILEMHHTKKKDKPSGTALMIGDQIGISGKKVQQYHSIRASNIIGEHQVLLSLPGEQVIITHRVWDRAVFALGAIKAASWLTKQKPGSLYNYLDIMPNLS